MVSISFWRLEAAAALVSQLLKFEMKTDSAFGAPGRTPRELARSGSWALTPNRRPSRRDLLNFLGCSLEPPTFASAIKCHQKGTSNSAGSSVGSLAPPRATPRLGGVYVSCQYFPCSFVLRPARARPSVGGQSPTPAPRQLPWSPPRGWCSRVR